MQLSQLFSLSLNRVRHAYAHCCYIVRPVVLNMSARKRKDTNYRFTLATSETSETRNSVGHKESICLSVLSF